MHKYLPISCFFFYPQKKGPNWNRTHVVARPLGISKWLGAKAVLPLPFRRWPKSQSVSCCCNSSTPYSSVNGDRGWPCCCYYCCGCVWWYLLDLYCPWLATEVGQRQLDDPYGGSQPARPRAAFVFFERASRGSFDNSWVRVHQDSQPRTFQTKTVRIMLSVGER